MLTSQCFSCYSKKYIIHSALYHFIITISCLIKDRLNHILAENTGKPFDVVHNDCERDNFMTAQEAVEYGLIDKVFDKH